MKRWIAKPHNWVLSLTLAACVLSFYGSAGAQEASSGKDGGPAGKFNEKVNQLAADLGINDVQVAFAKAASGSESGLPMLTASAGGGRFLEQRDGGAGAFIFSCCLPGVPAGQIYNSGYAIPSRSYIKLIPGINVIAHIVDAFSAGGGETAEDYLKVDDISIADGERKGFGSALATCCLPFGVPAGQVYNSGVGIKGRQIIYLIAPGIATLIDTATAMGGENLQQYLGIE